MSKEDQKTFPEKGRENYWLEAGFVMAGSKEEEEALDRLAFLFEDDNDNNNEEEDK